MVSVACPAKINLALSVGAPRPSDGYHPLCSWMVRVSLYDDLEIRRSEGAASSHLIRWADDAPTPSPIDWPVEKDLIVKAHRLLEQEVGRDLPAAAVLSKRIPVGAGMGGGSSDGANMLAALRDLFDLPLDRDALSRLAARLGSDVSFFLGAPSAIVSGTGEVVEDQPLAATFHLALVVPALHCNTGAVYRTFDAGAAGATVDEDRVRRMAAAPILDPDEPFNDLAEAAMTVEPRLRGLRERCIAAAGRQVHVTGSGAAMFAVAESEEDATRVAARIHEATGAAALAVRTL